LRITIVDEIANVAFHLSKGLSSKGHHVTAVLDIARKLPRLLFVHKKLPNVDVKWIKPLPIKPRAFGLALPMIRAIIKSRPHVINVQYLWSQLFISWFAAKLLGVPIIGTGHGWEVLDVPKSRIRGRIQRWFLNRLDRIIVTAEYYKEHLPVPKEKMVYIPRMIDTDMFRPGIPCDDIIEKYGNHIVTFIARLYPIKTPYKTLDAFRKALDVVPDAHLLILGVGPEYEGMVKHVKELGMEDHVHFLGEVPNTEIPRYLNASKAEVRGFNPETPELGISHLEALACGTPVLTYTDYKDMGGVIVALEVDDIAKHLIRILTDKEFHDELARQGREYVMKNFSIEAATQKTLEIFYEELKKRKSKK